MAASRPLIPFLGAVMALFITSPAMSQEPAAAPATAPAAAAAPVAPAASTISVTPYRINPGDELQIFVWGEERLQRSVKVLPDGSFSFPLVGRVDAMNKLPTDLETIVSNGLKAQYKGDVPQVTVSVTSPAGFQFSIVGKVRNPGTFTPGRYVNVLEALSFAGGPADFAQLGNIIIVRKQGEGLTSFRVRLSDLLKGSPSQQDLSPSGIPQIQGGDTVIVP